MDRITEVNGQDAVSEVRKCFDRIMEILIETAANAERINDAEMLERLVAARAAAARGGELASRLSTAFQKQSGVDHGADIPASD